jgi:hypothetical protein
MITIALVVVDITTLLIQRNAKGHGDR